ncbi:NAD(P)-dependent oxidoreductase [Marinomonas sp. RSW2]|uniref:NAD(P)-dependent oxidoreductase n=1 Tax=Marinomonas maritima TaxID=2940935 RepID=A0ABT5W9W1_9GAMM|nr:NAD(P)-dependent oxidoreductase [Marinomonas maritima]MDE8601615.1 NAD(P)-dependent oxidoreductase [Marinomonas maritima]
MKRVLISGITGFLGSHLAKALLSSGFLVYGIKRKSSSLKRLDTMTDQIVLFDLSDSNIEEVVTSVAPDFVIHTACDYGRSGASVSDLVKTNIVFSLSLLEASSLHKVKAFINTDSALPNDVNAYALSKYQFSQWGKCYSDKIKFINMRIEHMYGAGDDRNKFIHWFVEQLKKQVESIPLTSGIQLRDFIYIDDIVSAYLLIINHIDRLASYESFDVSTGKLMPVRDFLNAILKEYISLYKTNNVKLKFGELAFRENEMMAAHVSPKKLKSLGWNPVVTHIDGIKKIFGENK